LFQNMLFKLKVSENWRKMKKRISKEIARRWAWTRWSVQDLIEFLCSSTVIAVKGHGTKLVCLYDKCINGQTCDGCEMNNQTWPVHLEKVKNLTMNIRLRPSQKVNELKILFHQWRGELWSKSNNEEGLTMNDCLRYFTEEEQLRPDNSWYCLTCKQHQLAFKRLGLWKLPKTLIIGLKRFKQENFGRRKNQELVKFPLMGLDLQEYVLGPEQKAGSCKYNLYAVSNHFGDLSGGHYTAYIKHKSQWYHMNDNHFQKIIPSKVVSKQAYILFYRKADAE